MTGALCTTRPAEWWETGNPGSRLAVALCRVCPARVECADTAGDEAGVIRAGVAYHARGKVARVCHCGYPDDKLPDPRRTTDCCRFCHVPPLRNWSRRQYWARYYRERKAVKS